MTFISDSGTGLPVFDYSSRDYASILTDLVNRKTVYLPEWTSQSQADFGMVLLELFAYVGDLLGYYLDRLAGEAFIQTATQAVSIINLAAMLDYTPTLSIGATAILQVEISSSTVGPITIPVGTQFATQASPTQQAVVFQTVADLTIAGANGATPSTVGYVDVVQGTQYTDQIVATSDGSVDQTYPLFQSPVSADSFLVMVDIGNGPQEWIYVQDLISSGPYAQVYTNFVDANGVFYIIFGDGVNGYVPPLGSPITASYMTNVGATGNVGANTITQTVSAIIGVISVTNPSAASGGTAAESLASIQENAPASLRTLNRAVSVSDWQTLAIQVPGVQWASAIMATYQLVNLFIAPFGGGAPSSLLQGQVLDYIDEIDMAQTTVTIQSPNYVPINITIQLVVYSNFGNGTAQSLVQSALETLLALSNTGFGFRVSVGLVYQTIFAQSGVNYAFVTALNRQELVTLTSALSADTVYSILPVTPLPQEVYVGDFLTLNPGGPATQAGIAVASGGAAAGAVSIPVTPFTTNAAYPIGTPIQDITGVNDCVLLENEIPVVGTITFSPPTSGGLAGT